LVLGNEGNGPSKFWKKNHDYSVTIDKSTQSKTESLNVTTAAAILLYEINS
jgi:tRNA G18 (ribose-2'-O)-methylase SpoU